jgi:serine phosphatase RsbU (regulator of sigma subunit)
MPRQSTLKPASNQSSVSKTAVTKKQASNAKKSNASKTLAFDDSAKPSVATSKQQLATSLKQANDMVAQLQTVNQELQDRSLLIEKELSKTRLLQQSLLPPKLESASQASQEINPFDVCRLHYDSEQLRVHGLYMPCDAIGGDLYDLCEFSDNSLGVIITDVSGHGVPAAFITALLKASFYRITHQHKVPDQVLFHLNNQMASVVKTNDYLTAAYMHFINQGKTLQFAGAGHPYPLWYQASTHTVEPLVENGTPLVWMPDMPYGYQERALGAGDKVLLYTDGITELGNLSGELFGDERLHALFSQAVLDYPNDGQGLLESMLFTLSDFTEGEPLNDDMTMLLVEIKE